jgi:hypothetical protein
MDRRFDGTFNWSGNGPGDSAGVFRRAVNAAGIFALPNGGLTTTEAGAQTSFSVTLASAPTGNVTVPVSVSDPWAATISTTVLTFTPANWNVAQVVTVTGRRDFIVTPDRSYTLVLGAAGSRTAMPQIWPSCLPI